MPFVADMQLEDGNFCLIDLDSMPCYMFLREVEPQFQIVTLTTIEWEYAIIACPFLFASPRELHSRWKRALGHLEGFLLLWFAQGGRPGGRLRTFVRDQYDLLPVYVSRAQHESDAFLIAVQLQLRARLQEWRQLEFRFQRLFRDFSVLRVPSQGNVDWTRWMIDAQFRDVCCAAVRNIMHCVALREPSIPSP